MTEVVDGASAKSGAGPRLGLISARLKYPFRNGYYIPGTLSRMLSHYGLACGITRPAHRPHPHYPVMSQ